MNDSDSDNEMPSEQPRHTTSSAARRRRRSNARQAWFTQQQNYQNSSSTTTDSEPTNSNSDSASSSSSRGRRHSDRSRNSSSTRSTTRNESQFMSESRTRGIISSTITSSRHATHIGGYASHSAGSDYRRNRARKSGCNDTASAKATRVLPRSNTNYASSHRSQAFTAISNDESADDASERAPRSSERFSISPQGYSYNTSNGWAINAV
ncbi:hypothetical protein NFJ02_43g110500 [Pycnococcus provasolii]